MKIDVKFELKNIYLSNKNRQFILLIYAEIEIEIV